MPPAFLIASSRLVELLTNGPKPGTHPLVQLAVGLDQLALAVHETRATPPDPCEHEPPGDDYETRRELVVRRFPQLGYYNIPLDVHRRIAETTLAVGDGVDDLADLLGELQGVLWCRGSCGPKAAEGHFRFAEESHFGEHLADLRWYVHRLLTEVDAD